MKLSDLKKEVQKYQYMEDTKVIDVSIANIIANRLKIGDPVWLIIIGASSGGKSQILRPLSLTDTKFIHRIDDLTDNTFLSGAKSKDGDQNSLLLRIGAQGIIVISDFTVLMSKSPESKSTILSQFRMLYDGEMIKHSGNRNEPITWKGYLGIIAGSTPSIYSHFEEVADMGERFIYYRMKDFDPYKATHLALSRSVYGKELDNILANLYGDYVKEVIASHNRQEVVLSDKTIKRIIEVAIFSETVRTTAHKEARGDAIDRLPSKAMPMRVAIQLMAIAKSFAIIRHHESGSYELEESDLETIDWVGYSLANEEKRACLKILASVDFDTPLTTATIADKIGLDTRIIKIFLQNLSAVGILNRKGDEASNSLKWSFKDETNYNVVRRIEHINSVEVIVDRGLTQEEEQENDDFADNVFNEM